MGIFSRIATLIKSNLNDLISRSEDPEKMLNQIVVDMNEQLVEARKQVASSIADEKRLEKQAQEESGKAAEWERRAMLALRAGDENLAKEALARKKEHETLRDQFQEQWQKQKQAVEQLKLALRALNNKIEEAKRKKNLLIARKKRAEAQRTISETMSGLRNASAFEAFDRMAGNIERMEAEAEAAAEMHEQFTGDTLAHKFNELEATHGVDDDLVQLKRKMGMLPPEEPPRAQPVRVEGPPAQAAALEAAEQEELARALAELDAEQHEPLRLKRE
ncbi:MAG TPA: PspA/IM30 family protein [Polyangiaceae bacterium]|jgi:phage shock protein A|nr:PspA/IM30 family protein [Polyangiaceae bacterium]